MGDHSDSSILAPIQGNAGLLDNLDALTQELYGKLLSEYEKCFRQPLPTVEGALVRAVEFVVVSAKAQEDALVEEFTAGAIQLVKVVFADSALVQSACEWLIRVAVEDVMTGLSTVFQENHVKTPEGGFDIQCFAEVSLCHAKDWGTPSDFVAVYYAFVVMPA